MPTHVSSLAGVAGRVTGNIATVRPWSGGWANRPAREMPPTVFGCRLTPASCADGSAWPESESKITLHGCCERSSGSCTASGRARKRKTVPGSGTSVCHESPAARIGTAPAGPIAISHGPPPATASVPRLRPDVVRRSPSPFTTRSVVPQLGQSPGTDTILGRCHRAQSKLGSRFGPGSTESSTVTRLPAKGVRSKCSGRCWAVALCTWPRISRFPQRATAANVTPSLLPGPTAPGSRATSVASSSGPSAGRSIA